MEIGEEDAVVERLRERWSMLWRTRFDDRVRAEGIASESYPDLFVDRGQVIIATRDYKPLSFRSILDAYFPPFIVDVVDPNPSRIGVRRFIREFVVKQNGGRRKSSLLPRPKSGKGRQLKKGGRGWLSRSFDL